jgi:DMSO reductase anchor subunit
MTKCDFCYDNLEKGLPPACVAACPMRVLDYGGAETREGVALWNTSPEKHPFPLPAFSRTQPHLAIKLHPAMQTTQEKFVANHEEIQPRVASVWEEVPLILFTLLGQLAAGGLWVLWMMTDRVKSPVNLFPHLVIGFSLGVGMLASFAHLGTKKNAWRVLGHLSHSWLSREILFAGLFGLGWLSGTLLSVFRNQIALEAMALTSILGIGLVYSMSQVYRIPAAPGWNTWRTNASFIVSALLLGLSVMAPILLVSGSLFEYEYINIGIVVLALVQYLLMRVSSADRLYQNLRKGLLFLGILLSLIHIVFSSDVLWMSVTVFVFVAMEEGLGRWLFYRSRLG